MKRTILLSGMIGMALLLTSCLEEGSRNYEETSVAYMATDMETGRVYGRTLTGRFITSQNMQLMFSPGSFRLLHYSWTEEAGTTPIQIDNENVLQADNVVIISDPINVDQITLNLDTPTEVEEPDEFLELSEPFYANDEYYLGDHWLFEYAYEAREGEEASIKVYMVEDPESAANEVLLEIRLIIEGDPKPGASFTSRSDIIAVGMAPLRAHFEGLDEGKRDLKIQIQYYNKNSTEPMKLNNTYLLTIGNEA